MCSGHIRDFVLGKDIMIWEVSGIGSEITEPFVEFVILGMHRRVIHSPVLFISFFLLSLLFSSWCHSRFVSNIHRFLGLRASRLHDEACQ